MALEKSHVHRPGGFKQSNKEHKHGRHRSKGSISMDSKGKISLKTLSKKSKREFNRIQRRHQSLQLRQKKRNEVLDKKRSLGGMDFAPFLVCVVPLNKEFDPSTALSILTHCDEDAVIRHTSTGLTHICIPRFKKRFSFVVPPKDNVLDVLDTLKVADTVLFLLSAVNNIENNEELIDKWGNNILMSSFAQGLPTPVVALTDLESVAPKKRNEYKQSVQKLISQWLPKEKLVTLDKNVDGINILRKIGDQKRKTVLYRDRRPHLYGEEIEYVPDNEGSMGTLKVTGYLRGTTLSVNQLIHISGLGDFQMLQIDSPPDPNKTEKNKIEDCNVRTTIRVLEQCDQSKQESLDSENIPDSMDDEQVNLTEDCEMTEKETQVKKTTKVPEGWSTYQAAWIPEGDTVFEEDNSSESENQSEEEEEYIDAQSEEKSDYCDAEDRDFDTITESEIAVNEDKYDQDVDLLTEKEDLEKFKAAKSDLIFPDEIDTPLDVPATVRFQKYRGLESFRSSPWNPNENLPSDYARIFQFKNFDLTKRKLLKEEENKEGALPGWYITIRIKNISQLMWSSFEHTKSPVVVMGLFPYEHKMSALNVVLKRTKNYGFPIKSKERLIFQCGYRRFACNPVFSQHTNGQKHKFERFFQPNSVTVATFYAPIQFTPAPVLCYKEVAGSLILVATGNLLSCNAERLIIKRLVLSGHPLKIYKKSAIIRFMFFNREDIQYFKPCKLRTKMGRTGHIKEPLGTHGHMKCTFDGQLKSQDTVLLNLYKRVFPKWSYEDLVVSCVSNDSMET